MHYLTIFSFIYYFKYRIHNILKFSILCIEQNIKPIEIIEILPTDK